MVAPVIDTRGTNCLSTTATFAQPVSTTMPNELVFFLVQLNNQIPTSISDTDGLTWNQVAGVAAAGIPNLYWALKPNAGTTTVMGTLAVADHFKLLWFTLRGADLTNPVYHKPFNAGPQTGPTVSIPFSSSNPDDFILAYVMQTAGASLANVPTATPPWQLLVQWGSEVGCYSQACWFAGFGATQVYANVVAMPMTFTINNQVEGFIITIKAGVAPPPPEIDSNIVTVTVAGVASGNGTLALLVQNASNIPIAGATVFCTASATFGPFTTDSTGMASISLPPEPTFGYAVTIIAGGYTTKQVGPVLISAGATTPLTVTMT